MGFTLIDFVEGFHFMKARRRFSAGTQACYFAILTEFQLAGLPSELPLSTRELKELAGLKSVSATHEARNILKNNKLVDFKTVEGVTVYRLGTEHLPNTYRTLTEHPTEHLAEQQGLVCYTPAKENGETPSPTPLSPKSFTQGFKKSQPTQPNQTSLAEDVRSGKTGGRDTEIDVVELWRNATGKPLDSPADQFVLRQLDEKHGREIVKVAMEECVYCGGKSLRYFEKCLASTLTRLKGGEEDGRDSQKVRMDRRVGGERRDESSALGTSETAGKGRFDDEPEPDYDWIHAKQSDTSEGEG